MKSEFFNFLKKPSNKGIMNKNTIPNPCAVINRLYITASPKFTYKPKLFSSIRISIESRYYVAGTEYRTTCARKNNETTSKMFNKNFCKSKRSV